MEASQGGLIRIFVSSTFVDFQGERARLQTVILPLLREQARAKGHDIAFIDLRWGLSKAVASKGGYIHLCLSAARGADLVLGLLGGRYGSSPANIEILDLDLFQLDGSLRQAIESGVADRLSITHMELAYAAQANRLAFQRGDALTRQLERWDKEIPKDPEQPAPQQLPWTDAPGSPSADRAAALLRTLRDEGTPVLDYASLDEFTALALKRLQSWLEARLATGVLPAAPTIPLTPHSLAAHAAAQTVWNTGHLLLADDPRSGKTAFLNEVAHALTTLQGTGGQPLAVVHRLDLHPGEPPYRALAALLDTILGNQVRLGFIDPLALDPQALLALRGLTPGPVPVVLVDGLDSTDPSEPPPWLCRLTEHVPLMLAGRMGLQMMQLREAGWPLWAPPAFMNRDDAKNYLLARLTQLHKFFTPKQLEQHLDSEGGMRLGTINRVLEIVLGFGDLLPGMEADEHVTKNLGWLLAEHRLHKGWDYALAMLLNCYPSGFPRLLTALAGLVVARRGLTTGELEAVLGDDADRVGEVLVLLAGLLEQPSDRVRLRDAVAVSGAAERLPLLPQMAKTPEGLWPVLRQNAVSRLLAYIASRDGAATDETMLDTLHLLGEAAAIEPLKKLMQHRLLVLLRAGALGAALRTGDLTWLGSLIISRSVPLLGMRVLDAVRHFLESEKGSVEDVLPLARFLHRHGRTGAVVVGLAPAVAALAAQSYLRQPSISYSREQAGLAWLALDEWHSLGRGAIDQCKSVEELEQLYKGCNHAASEMDGLTDLLDATHLVAIKIHGAELAIAGMAARVRLQIKLPVSEREVASVQRHLSRIRRTIDESCWPSASTAELERRFAAADETLKAMRSGGR